MKSYSKKSQQIHGNESPQPRIRKQDVNLRKNGWLHFQIGLILSLMITYFTVEATFPFIDNPDLGKLQVTPDIIVEEPFVLQLPEPKPLISDPLSEPLSENSNTVGEEIKIIKNSENDLKETKNVVVTPANDPTDLSLKDIKYPTEDEEEIFSIMAVETVPLFPGCEQLSTNKEKIDCFSSELNKIISKNFNGSLGSDFGLEGIQRIHLVFKIDKKGYITDIKTRAPHPALAKEAERVIRMVPQLKPGKQSHRPVEVLFAKPIIFKVN
ncbi:energy transducer TonB [Ascidiimonas sp. W6]|uniref:energy transducer TonB n=1 Tax=Ascidiimonas meishanensis TaxID=3128903 RepID=UPI0030ECB234